MSSSSQDPKPVGTGKPVAVLSSQSRLNRDTFSERNQLVDVAFGSSEPMANVAKSLLDGNRDHLLTQATSGRMKQAIGIAGRPPRAWIWRIQQLKLQ